MFKQDLILENNVNDLIFTTTASASQQSLPVVPPINLGS